jgi:hypothetical protein
MDKTLLLASFIFPERLDWFLGYLKTNFNIPKEKIFCYKNLKDQSKLILTFKFLLQDGKHVDLKKLFPSAIIIHKKGTAFYTINALNKLIEIESEGSLGNIDHKSHKIDWEKYKDQFILLENKELVFLNLERVF